MRSGYNTRYHKSYFLMITDNGTYARKYRIGTTGSLFTMYNGVNTRANSVFSNPNCKGRMNVSVELRDSYEFNWIEDQDWHFMKLDI